MWEMVRSGEMEAAAVGKYVVGLDTGSYIGFGLKYPAIRASNYLSAGRFDV